MDKYGVGNIFSEKVKGDSSKVEDDRTYIVTEACSHCESEIEMRWDTDTRGFKAFCPVCGKRLMLCDECLHGSLDGACAAGGCDYDNVSDTCRMNPPENSYLSSDMNGCLKSVMGINDG